MGLGIYQHEVCLCVWVCKKERHYMYREHFRAFLPTTEPFLNNQPDPSPENTEIQRVKGLLGRTSQSDAEGTGPGM